MHTYGRKIKNNNKCILSFFFFDITCFKKKKIFLLFV